MNPDMGYVRIKEICSMFRRFHYLSGVDSLVLLLVL